MKLGKYVPFCYFSRGRLDLWTILLLLLTSRHSLTVGAFAAPASQFANQLLGGFSHVFRHYIPGGCRVSRAAFSDISKDFATGTQRLANHCFGPAPQQWADPAEEAAEKNCLSRVRAEGRAGRSRRDRSPGRW